MVDYKQILQRIIDSVINFSFEFDIETLKKETSSTNRGLFIFAIFAAICIVLLIGMNFKSNRDISDLKYAYQVAQDSLVVTYNALKQQSSKVEVLSA